VRVTAKVQVVRTPKMAKLALPVLGGVVLTALTVLWLTSAFWFFTTVDFPGDLTMKPKTFNAIVELMLLAGAIVFVALLAGMDLGLIAS